MEGFRTCLIDKGFRLISWWKVFKLIWLTKGSKKLVDGRFDNFN